MVTTSDKKLKRLRAAMKRVETAQIPEAMRLKLLAAEQGIAKQIRKEKRTPKRRD